MSFNLYQSNNLEKLFEKLSVNISGYKNNPFQSDIILVQSMGMRKWLSLKTASSLNIMMNVDFLFPNQFLEKIFAQIDPSVENEPSLNQSAMTWKIYSILPILINTEKSKFADLTSYLSGNSENYNIKLFQLSEKISETFFQYQLYRTHPDDLQRIAKEFPWQKILLETIAQDTKFTSITEKVKSVISELITNSHFHSNLPERISIFGLYSLPEILIEFFYELSKYIEIDIYFKNPSKEYWGYIEDPKKIAKIEKFKNIDSSDAHFEVGNQLLAIMGKLGKDCLTLLFNKDIAIQYDEFDEINAKSLLSNIQYDILNLIDRESSSNKVEISNADNSVQVISAHNKMREIEILYDNILDIFNSDNSILPQDIIIMAPNIEEYSPYIDTVFSANYKGTNKIHYTIADRSPLAESKAINLFFDLLNLYNKRFTSTEIIDLIKQPLLHKKFDIGETDIDKIIKWVVDTNIRWGIDINHIQEEIPEFNTDENTWLYGLKRALLGYALPSEISNNYYNKLLTYSNIEGSDAIIFGNFYELINKLIEIKNILNEVHSLEDWAEILEKIVQDCIFEDDNTNSELTQIFKVADNLKNIYNNVFNNSNIEIRLLIHFLENEIKAQQQTAKGFLSGGITFCSMLPMRSIPFKIVCLIGMNGDDFPRKNIKIGFNHIAQFPKTGDRDSRNDDSYLFLEAILSAKEQLYISYIGQSTKDNSEIQPSILVNRLIDYIKNSYKLSNSSCENSELDIEKHIIKIHKLQAFNKIYFNQSDKSFFSYSKKYLNAALNLIKNGKDDYLFIDINNSQFSDIPTELLNISISDFIKFFENTSKYFLERRANLYLEEKSDIEPIDDEPFDLDNLESYSLKDEIINNKLNGKSDSEIFSKMSSLGEIPKGNWGKVIFNSNKEIALEVFREIKDELIAPQNIFTLGELGLKGITISGNINNIFNGCYITYKPSTLKSKNILRAVIINAILSYSKTDYKGLKTFTINETYNLDRIEKDTAYNYLLRLANLYIEGLYKPLAFFCNTSYKYVKTKDENKLEFNFYNTFMPSEYGNYDFEKDGNNIYHSLIYKNSSTWTNHEFIRILRDYSSSVYIY